jgi:outer membrane protein OmpA-like peptidoglycan-associated protein
MLHRTLPLAIAMSLGLGLADLAYLNLHLVPRLLEERSERADQPVMAARVVEERSAARPSAPEPPARRARPAPPAAAKPLFAVDANPPGRAATPLASSDVQQREGAPPDAEPSVIVVHFARNRATLSSSGRRALDRTATRLLATRHLTASIEGHTDHRGDEAHNELLSLRRAERVADYLVARGLPRGRLVVRAHGASQPRAPGDELAALRANRRVEIIVYEEQP